MKPCRKNRKLIVWLAVNALDAAPARELRAHLETCANCRSYLAEISHVTERLATIEATPDIQASENFHRRVVGGLRTARHYPVKEILAAGFRRTRLTWRVALPAITALVVIGVAIATWRQPPDVSSPAPSGIQTVSVSDADNDLAPTFANYQMVAHQSLARLDALLTRQGNRGLPPMPIYTASTLTLANGSF